MQDRGTSSGVTLQELVSPPVGESGTPVERGGRQDPTTVLHPGNVSTFSALESSTVPVGIQLIVNFVNMPLVFGRLTDWNFKGRCVIE